MDLIPKLIQKLIHNSIHTRKVWDRFALRMWLVGRWL
jgi:hypothetical protein